MESRMWEIDLMNEYLFLLLPMLMATPSLLDLFSCMILPEVFNPFLLLTVRSH